MKMGSDITRNDNQERDGEGSGARKNKKSKKISWRLRDTKFFSR